MAPMISADDVSGLTGMPANTIRMWARQGKIPGAHKLNGTWRFDKAKVRGWIKQSEAKEDAPCLSISAGMSGGSALKPKATRLGSRLDQALNLTHLL